MGCEKSKMHTENPPDYAAATASSELLTPSSTGASTTTTQTTDAQPEPTKGQTHPFAMLSLSGTDRLRFIRFPEPLTALASEIIQAFYPKGIQNVAVKGECVELKLKGNPLMHGMDDEKIAMRLVLLGILNGFMKAGWGVLPGGRATRLGYSGSGCGVKDSLIFRYGEPRTYSWLCASFDSSDLLHLLNAPTELATALIHHFGDKLEHCNKDLKSGNFEVKFTGNPWSRSSGKGEIQNRLILLDLMQCLENQHYMLCTSVDIDEGYGGKTYQSNGELWFWYR